MNELMHWLMRGWHIVFSMEYNEYATYVYLQNSNRFSMHRFRGLYL